jgi:hypothetical protein
MKWFSKVADQGYADAQYNVGAMYANGQGVAQSYDVALKWFRKAADQGYADAQYNLGLLYDNGRGAPQDHGEAVKWYRKAADQGHADAQYSLGSKYAKSLGIVPKAAPRGPLPRKSSSNTSAAEVTSPAPESASATMAPPLAAGPGKTTAKTTAKTMAKALPRTPETKTKAPPGESSNNSSTAEVALPAPESASVIVPPPAPVETMIKAPPRTPETKMKAVKTPPKAKNGAQVPNTSPKTPGAKVAGLPSAPLRAGIRIQLGSMQSKARAEKEAQRLARVHKSLLDGLKIVLVRAKLGERGIFYRLRAGPISNYSAAASLCSQLSARKQGCIVIKP